MTQVVKTSVAEQVKSVTEKLEKLQTIHESVYKTGSNFATSGFGAIQTETKIENLIKMASAVTNKAKAYDVAARETLGLITYPVYKENGFTDEEIVSDIKLRIAIITTESKRNELLEIKRGFEELMDKEDKMALLLQKIENL